MYLIQNAEVYAPEKLGKRDLLVVGEMVVTLDSSLSVSLPGLEKIDAKGMIVTPGLIDQHVHIIGGGGEGGPVSRVPEVMLSKLVASGTTTVVGVAGTDSVTRSISAVLAKIRALKAEGISGWIYTSNYAFPPTTMGRTVRDDLFLVPEVLGVKIAYYDHRSSCPTRDEILRLLSDVRVGGMIAGKIGVLHVHLGDLPGAFTNFNAIVDAGMPAKHIRPTHCGRQDWLYKESLEFTKRGGVIDVTSGGAYFAPLPDLIKLAMDSGANMDNITLSTDGNGSMPRFDTAGTMIGLGTGSVSGNLEALQATVAKGEIPLEKVLPLITSNVAKHLELKGKGRLDANCDADICFFDQNFNLEHVMARGKFLMRNSEILAKGTFEE